MNAKTDDHMSIQHALILRAISAHTEALRAAFATQAPRYQQALMLEDLVNYIDAQIDQADRLGGKMKCRGTGAQLRAISEGKNK